MALVERDNTRIVDPQVLSRFHPVHQVLLEHLLCKEVGLFSRNYTIKKIERCGQNFILADREKLYYDMFLLTVPVCGDEKLEWQVILNEFKPETRPDFKVFHAGFGQYLVKNLIRSGIFHYNAKDESALLNLVERLKKMYYEYVLCSLNVNSHAYHNITNLLDMFTPQLPYEIFHSHGLVHVSLLLNLDLSRVQLTLPPEDCTVILTLTSPYPHEADIDFDTRLTMSPGLEEQLNMDYFKPPKFGRDKPMLAFVRLLINRLQGHIHEVATVQLLRKRYLLGCVAHARSAVICWDAIHFRSGTFLLSSEFNGCAFSYLLRLNITGSVYYDLVSIYTSRVILKGQIRLDSEPKELFVKLSREGEGERAANAVRGLVERLMGESR